MKKKSVDELGSQLKTVMHIVWDLGEATVHDVRDRLNPDLAYTTVLSTLQYLERSGWLTHRTEGRMNIYTSTRTQKQEKLRSLNDFTKRIFGGDPLLLFEHLVEDERLTEEDLKAIRKMIDQKRKEKHND